MPEARLKVLSVFGTRPEAIKMAPVVLELARRPEIESQVCVTAQHREMLDQVLALFDIQPAIDLNLMRPNQTLSGLTAAVLEGMQPVLERLKPDWILIQGDTTTVMATALLAYYHRIRVGHVEAGLRTGDKWQPFPEEINRRIASVVGDLHFAPTDWARANLLREGIAADSVVVTGNPVIDALQIVVAKPFDLNRQLLNGVPEDSRLVLVTAHRRENFGRPLENIFQALIALAERYREALHIVYPVHLNPNVYEPAHRMLGKLANIHLLEPLDYLPMAHLMQRAHIVLTDSGGIQEEAPALGTPVLVLRQVTERPEAIQAGTARLVGSDPGQILDQACRLLDDPAAHQEMARAINPYGDGHAAKRIVDALLQAGA